MQKKFIVFAVTAVLLAVTGMARAATLEELQKQVDELSGQVKAMSKGEAESKAAAEPAREGYLRQVLSKTTFGGYGELDYIFKRENGNGKGGNTFDPRRFVLYVNSDFTDWITLNTELEWEHGGIPDGDDGGVSVEQAYVDFKFYKQLNVKAGVMLVPVGAINLNHEPTNFNSTTRPQLDQVLIPTTWSEMGIGLHGKLSEMVDYQLLVMNGLDGTQFSAGNGLREGRQKLNMDNNRNKAVTGRLDIRPMQNLQTNFSFYTANSAPSGQESAYTTIAAFDGKYSLGAFDLAGEYVQVFQEKPALLSADIGHRMSGYWVEGAWHCMPAGFKTGKLADSDLIAFARWSEFDTQQGNIADPAKASGRYDRNYTTFGLVFKPTTTVAIKADYQIYDDKRKAGETPLDNDKFQITLGFVF